MAVRLCATRPPVALLGVCRTWDLRRGSKPRRRENARAGPGRRRTSAAACKHRYSLATGARHAARVRHRTTRFEAVFGPRAKRPPRNRFPSPTHSSSWEREWYSPVTRKSLRRDRTRTRRCFYPRNGRTISGSLCSRFVNVAPGYRRLSWSRHRDYVTDIDAFRRKGRNRPTERPSVRVAQPLCSQASHGVRKLNPEVALLTDARHRRQILA
jgi:hypothetical protein